MGRTSDPRHDGRMRSRLALPSLLALAACTAMTDPAEHPAAVRDPHSRAQPDRVAVRHLDLDLTLDFTEATARGRAALTVVRHDPAAPLVLDTRGLVIARVTDATGRELPYRLGAEDPILGSALTIELRGETRVVVVHYATGREAAALQWLSPAQTAGGTHPFLFTQGQAILTRTWIPIQDSPGIRMTWNARIRSPEGLVPLMSASTSEPDPDGGTRFGMHIPVPSYLIALACGNLVRREISPRCAVWAEPATIDIAASEFADTERMITACEELYGPYAWGRYDVLVLPPSFPFGGMENPCLTFATPTILAGDRSLVSLIAHELAHSWSGNLVTNATWNDFWLNEGFTVYLEQRILERLYGPERAAMEVELAMQGLVDELATLPAGDQRLRLDLAGRDPDDGMTAVAYDKGAAFLRRLEQLYGRERFDRFVRGYFAAHPFQSMTTDAFLAHLQANLLDSDPALAAQLDLETWLRGSGLPPDTPELRSRALAAVDAAMASWHANRDLDALASASSGWTTQQWLRAIAFLPTPCPVDVLAALDARFGFTSTANAEIACAWLELATRSRYEAAMPALDAFLGKVGRRKFLKPLYEALQDTSPELARATYLRHRDRYHAVAVRTLDDMLLSGNPR